MKKACNIHYRVLDRDNGNLANEQTLSQVVTAAFSEHIDGNVISDNYEYRVAPHPTDQSHKLIANNITIEDNFVFGNLCMFSPGKLQAMLDLSGGGDHKSLDEVLKELGIKEAPAPDGHEFLHGMAYWLIIDDHVLIIQHQAVQTKVLESYFYWLLSEQTDHIGDDTAIVLKSVFDRNAVGGDLGDIKEVEVGGVVQSPDDTSSSSSVEEIEEKRSLGEQFAQFGKAREILNQVLGEAEAARLLAKLPDEAALEVAVRFSYRSKRRKLSRAALSDLAVGLRNLPDGEVRTSGEHGKSRGDDVRLHVVRRVALLSDSSNLLDLDSAFDEMRTAYLRFVEDELIE